jgi:hypothetical protein
MPRKKKPKPNAFNQLFGSFRTDAEEMAHMRGERLKSTQEGDAKTTNKGRQKKTKQQAKGDTSETAPKTKESVEPQEDSQ